MRKTAIYARKSVYREDSISIETQIEYCKTKLEGEDYVIYQDNGFSGKDTDRPDFKRMERAIKNGKIGKVIVYKLDRISRSMLDFQLMLKLFEQYNVGFIAATEFYDTTNPQGKMIANINMTYAQFEREQIKMRVKHAYESRSEKGFFMGGAIPYGYKRTDIEINGVKTVKFEPEPKEAEEIQLIYSLYSNPSYTLNDVLKELARQGKNFKSRNNKPWNTARLSEVMRSPVYVKADYNIYHFFKEHETIICNPIEQFDGEHACYFFKYENKNRKTWDLKNTKLVIAPHKGIISSDTWLACRKKLLNNHQIKTCKPKNSFLAGKVKCGVCGYAMVIRKSKTKAGRYFVCQGKSENHCCKAEHKTIYATEFENMILERITDKINSLTIIPIQDTQNEQALKTRELKIKIDNIDTDISSLVDKISEADNLTMQYINQRIQELHNQKSNLQLEIDKIEHLHTDNETKIKQLANVMNLWNKLTFDDKVGVINLLIKKIVVYPEKTEIQWLL